MDKFKRILAIGALLAMAVFLMATVVLMITGQLGQKPGWVYGPLTGFLAMGLTSLLINYLQKRAAKAKAEDQTP